LLSVTITQHTFTSLLSTADKANISLLEYYVISNEEQNNLFKKRKLPQHKNYTPISFYHHCYNTTYVNFLTKYYTLRTMS